MNSRIQGTACLTLGLFGLAFYLILNSAPVGSGVVVVGSSGRLSEASIEPTSPTVAGSMMIRNAAITATRVTRPMAKMTVSD